MASVLSSSFELQPLRAEWIRSAWRLSSQSGWNQTEEDWRRLLRLPGSLVRAFYWEGEVRASHSVIAYGKEVAWIGMVLVDQAYRGQGWGKQVLADALKIGKTSDVAGLDATSLGKPIYAKNGFQDLVPIIRWTGKSPESTRPSREVNEGWTPAILDLDRECAGCDRSALLEDLANSNGRFFHRTVEGRTQAYGVIRPGREAWHLGPIVAKNVEDFQRVLESLFATCIGELVICDVLNPLAGPVLEKQGLSPARDLQRMTLPLRKDCLCGPEIWCGAGFEWG